MIIMMNKIIRKCRFYRSLFYNFSRADDHWEVTLALKSASPCRFQGQESRAFKQPVSRKSHERFVLSGWDSMCQPYIESATALSDILAVFIISLGVFIYLWLYLYIIYLWLYLYISSCTYISLAVFIYLWLYIYKTNKCFGKK